MRIQKKLQQVLGVLALFLFTVLGLLSEHARAVQDQVVYRMTKFDLEEKFYKTQVDHKINVDLNKVSLEEALRIIAEKAGLRLTYRGDIFDEHKIDLEVENIGVTDALDYVLQGTDLEYMFSRDSYLLIQRKDENLTDDAVQVAITGTVIDGQTMEALPGANVAIQGTTQGSSTNIDGEYSIGGIDAGTYNLVASFIGYQTSAREITVTGEEEELVIDFSLEPSDMALDELVVVGYGQQERADITGSISSVRAEDLNAVSTSNAMEALQGQSAGVLVTQASGEPGANMDIMIRGASTLGNTEPLYVIDGIPSDGDLSQINMSNIESMEILKDASSAAIYGSRAANGVVMITTKRGSAGVTQVDASIRGGVSRIPDSRKIEMMNSEQFYEYSVDAYTNAGLPIPEAWEEPYLSQNLQQNTDWLDEFFKSGSVQDYNVTVSGGNENAVYSFSGGYLNQDGTAVGSGFSRGSFRINSEFYIGEDQKLTIGENIELSQSKSLLDSGFDTFKETFQQSPTVPLRCPENVGGFCGPTNETSPGFRLNQVALRYLNENENITQRLLGTVYADYNLLPNLSYRLNVSTDMFFGKSQSFSPVYDLQSNVNAEADLEQGRSESRSIIIENTLDYNLVLNDGHELDLLAGYTQESRKFESFSASAQNFPGENLRTIDAALGQTTVSGGATESALQSLLGRMVYEYDDRYRAQIAVRRDGSSRFGSNSRWGTFPSVSASWTISNEAFMQDVDYISRLTLRGSWGVTGTQTIPDFAAVATVDPVASYIFGEGQVRVPGSAAMQVGNADLQWQETKQVDIGLDADFLEGRLNVVFDYYNKNTTNLLLQIPIPTSSGFWRNNGAFQNVGEVVNSGIEIGADYQHSIGDFSYQLRANFSTVHNEVKDIGVPSIIVSVSDELGQGQTITRPGSEIGAFYGYISEGPFRDQADVDNHAAQSGAEPGDLKFRDLNNDGVINSDDRTIIGSPFPDFFYGLTANLNYKNWGLRIQTDGVQGRDIFALRSDNDVKGFNNATTDYLDRWTPENPDGAHPRAHTTDPNSNLRSSTYRVKDGSYYAVRNIMLSYNFDPELLSRWINLRNLRLFVNASNLFWFTSYDGFNPEIGAGGGDRASLTRSMDNGTYPLARTFEIGLNVGF